MDLSKCRFIIQKETLIPGIRFYGNSSFVDKIISIKHLTRKLCKTILRWKDKIFYLIQETHSSSDLGQLIIFFFVYELMGGNTKNIQNSQMIVSVCKDEGLSKRLSTKCRTNVTV